MDSTGHESVYSGDGSSTTTILVAVLVPVFVVGAIIVLVAVVAVTLLITWKRRNFRSKTLDRLDSLNAADSSAKLQEVPN